jgi:hypothetical protein
MHTEYTDVIYRMEGYFKHGELSLLPFVLKEFIFYLCFFCIYLCVVVSNSISISDNVPLIEQLHNGYH